MVKLTKLMLLAGLCLNFTIVKADNIPVLEELEDIQSNLTLTPEQSAVIEIAIQQINNLANPVNKEQTNEAKVQLPSVNLP